MSENCGKMPPSWIWRLAFAVVLDKNTVEITKEFSAAVGKRGYKRVTPTILYIKGAFCSLEGKILIKKRKIFD